MREYKHFRSPGFGVQPYQIERKVGFCNTDIGTAVAAASRRRGRAQQHQFSGSMTISHLRQLGVDIVKIDGAFVRDIITSDDDRAFARSLIELAQRLKLKTVAEWVQDEEAAKTLRDWGCDYLQGALIGLASAERPWLARATQTQPATIAI